MANPVDIKVTIAIADPGITEKMCRIVSAAGHVRAVRVYSTISEAFKALSDGQADSLMVNPFNLEMKAAIGLISDTRERVPHVPICLIGTTRQLALLNDVPDGWRERLAHYYKLPLDLPEGQLQVQTEHVVELLAFYLISRMAQVRLHDLRNMLGSHRALAIDGLRDQQQSIHEAIDLAEKAITVHQETLGTTALVVPGFEGRELQDLVKGTLEKASRSLETTSKVNRGILIFGAILLTGSFIVAVAVKSWEAVSFGGFGIAGVVAALIVNPLKSISLGARRLVQIQVAYLGFLNQLAILNNNAGKLDKADVAARSAALNTASTQLLDALAKHFE